MRTAARGGARNAGSAANRATSVSTISARSTTSQTRRALAMSVQAMGSARSDIIGVFGR